MARFPEPIGWPLLPVPDNAGSMSWPTLDESIRQHIMVLLQTRPGEQLMRPRFGGGLQRFIGLPDTVETRRRIHDRIQETLNRWERRAIVEAIDIGDGARPGNVRVDIRIRIRRTGVIQRIGLNLALQQGS